MTLDKQIVNVVNPQRRDLAVYYPGPAYDIISPLEKTQGSRFVFVDVWDPAFGTIDQQLQRIQEDIKSRGGKVQKFERVSDNLAVIAFDYQNRDRKIDYHLKRNACHFTPPELLHGYDVYFSKGAGPLHDPYYLARMIRLMTIGGYFVSFDSDLVSHDSFRDGKLDQVAANFDLEGLGFRGEGVVDGYSLFRKMRYIKNEFEILLPTYFGLVLQEIETFMKEFKKDAEWEIGKLIGWRRGIRDSVTELNRLAPLLREKFTAELRSRLVSVNRDVKMLNS